MTSDGIDVKQDQYGSLLIHREGQTKNTKNIKEKKKSPKEKAAVQCFFLVFFTASSTGGGVPISKPQLLIMCFFVYLVIYI